MIRAKISMLGSFAVGKTSLVRRFVSGIFSERYETTVGVRIDKKTLSVDGEEVVLVLWDIHGEDEFQRVRASYLRGTAGYLLVVDGTRAHTLDTAEQLHALAREAVGDVPVSLLINKSDLADDWEIDETKIDALRGAGWSVRLTSAKTGLEVDDAFVELARRIRAG